MKKLLEVVGWVLVGVVFVYEVKIIYEWLY